MKQFFKFFFASLLGTLISFILLLIIAVAMIAGIFSKGSEVNEIKEHSILNISLNQEIYERSPLSPFQNFSFSGKVESAIGLDDILKDIRKARNDKKIEGIYLDLSNVNTGMASTEEIRNALMDFKESKKFIIAYGEILTQKAYYLASVADKVYLNPEGLLEFKGFSSQITFFKGALDKLGIEAQVIKVGTYKSAVEPFILDKMSEPNREQVSSFLGSLYACFLDNIALSRQISRDSLFNIANELRIQNAGDALQYKLVDGLKYKDEVIAELKQKTGKSEKDELSFVGLKEYSHTPEVRSAAYSKSKIAIIYAVGDIISGEGDDQEYMGSERLSTAIRKARQDEQVKGIVLRVNSPGGSALASDVIWREVQLAKKIKPVIVSMGDVAASGGYYISCAADKIVAEPNTITGSIGVFGILPNAKSFFNNKLGITFDGVKTGEYADLGNITRPLSETERWIIQKEVNRIYDDFISRVAEGRHKTKAEIDSIGQGRVWSGTEALKIGLVDTLGNIDDAVRIAAKMAKLPSYRIVNYPTMKDPIEEFLKDISGNVKTRMVKEELGENYKFYNQIKNINKYMGIQARIPYELNID